MINHPIIAGIIFLLAHITMIAIVVKIFKENNNKKCQHKSDGLVYCSNPPQYKCKNCGQMYK